LTKSKAIFTIQKVKQTLHIKEKIMNTTTAIPLGIAIGAAIGAATDNMAVWVGIGAALGLALHMAFRSRNNESKE
jgi:hypothetical protein